MFFTNDLFLKIWKADDNDDADDDDATLSTVPATQDESSKRLKCNTVNASIQDESNDKSKCDTVQTMPVLAPLPQIVVHQHFPFFDKAASRYTTSNDSLLGELRRRKWIDLERAAESRVEADLASSHEVS